MCYLKNVSNIDHSTKPSHRVTTSHSPKTYAEIMQTCQEKNTEIFQKRAKIKSVFATKYHIMLFGFIISYSSQIEKFKIDKILHCNLTLSYPTNIFIQTFHCKFLNTLKINPCESWV